MKKDKLLQQLGGAGPNTGELLPLIEGELYLLTKKKWARHYCKLYANRFCIMKYESRRKRKKRGSKIVKEILFSVEHYVQKVVNKSILNPRKHGFLLSDFNEKLYFSGIDPIATEFWQKATGGAIAKLQDEEYWWDEPGFNVEESEHEKELAYQERLEAYMRSRGAKPEDVTAKETELEEEAAVAEIIVDEARMQLNKAMIKSYRIENEDLAILLEQQRILEEQQKAEMKRVAEAEEERRREKELEQARAKKEEEERKRLQDEIERLAKEAEDEARKEAEAEARARAEEEKARREEEAKRQEEEERKRQEEEERKKEEEAERLRLMEAEKQRLERLLQESQAALKRAKEKEAQIASTLKAAEELALEAERKRLIEAKRISVMPMQNFNLQTEMKKYENEQKMRVTPKVRTRRDMVENFRQSIKYSSGVTRRSNETPVRTPPSVTKPKVKRVPKKGIANRLAMWQDKIDQHMEGQSANVFSASYKEGNKPRKGSKSYGVAAKGSASANRAEQASAWVEKEIDKLVQTIKKIGEYDESKGGYTVDFGKLFVTYENISDSLVGILMRAKKRNRIYYAGTMLYQ